MITGMNHAVLYVRDARAQQRFYADVLDFETIVVDDEAALRLHAGAGLDQPPRHRLLHDRCRRGDVDRRAHQVGLYHLAWEVPTIDDLAAMRDRLAAAGALLGASDHGGNKSLYAAIPTASSSR